jgi:hypothetical protein
MGRYESLQYCKNHPTILNLPHKNCCKECFNERQRETWHKHKAEYNKRRHEANMKRGGHNKQEVNMDICEFKYAERVLIRDMGIHEDVKPASHRNKKQFQVKFCPNCHKAWEYYYSKGGTAKGYYDKELVEYYDNFPSLGCGKEICPKCKEKELK